MRKGSAVYFEEILKTRVEIVAITYGGKDFERSCGDDADNRYFGASLPPAAVRMRSAEAFASRMILSTS